VASAFAERLTVFGPQLLDRHVDDAAGAFEALRVLAVADGESALRTVAGVVDRQHDPRPVLAQVLDKLPGRFRLGVGFAVAELSVPVLPADDRAEVLELLAGVRPVGVVADLDAQPGVLLVGYEVVQKGCSFLTLAASARCFGRGAPGR
jgi:hypothetical protein